MDTREGNRVNFIADKDHQVVMREELDEQELDEVVGGQLDFRQIFSKVKKSNTNKKPMKAWWFF